MRRPPGEKTPETFAMLSLGEFPAAKLIAVREAEWVRVLAQGWVPARVWLLRAARLCRSRAAA